MNRKQENKKIVATQAGGLLLARRSQRLRRTKRVLLLIIAPFVFLSAFAAPITQKEADEIVLERMSQEMQPYTIYAKADVQTKMAITATNGKTLELDYACWVYYISYTDAGRYLIIKEDNGNLLEINAKNNVEPDDLAEWRVFKTIITPVLIAQGTFDIGNNSLVKQNLVIKTQAEFNNLKNTMNFVNTNVTDNFTEKEIDFSKYQVIAVFDEIDNYWDVYRINIEEIIEYSDSLVVSITSPINKGQTQRVSHPYHIVKIPKSEKKIVFQDGIVGRWKLVEISMRINYQYDKKFDYSKDNIIYDFQKNNKLTISGNNIPDDLFMFDDFQAGEHFYEYKKLGICPVCLPGPNLQIVNPKTGQRGHYYYCKNDLNNNNNKIIKISIDGKVIEGDFVMWGKTLIKLK